MVYVVEAIMINTKNQIYIYIYIKFLSFTQSIYSDMQYMFWGTDISVGIDVVSRLFRVLKNVR
jgi:hypothetical protein